MVSYVPYSVISLNIKKKKKEKEGNQKQREELSYIFFPAYMHNNTQAEFW